MPAKSKSTKRRVAVKDTRRVKTLTKEDQKKVRGGLLPYIEQDNLKKINSRVTDITDGTSNKVLKQ